MVVGREANRIEGSSYFESSVATGSGKVTIASPVEWPNSRKLGRKGAR